jgi:hypothetical protein
MTSELTRAASRAAPPKLLSLNSRHVDAGPRLLSLTDRRDDYRLDLASPASRCTARIPHAADVERREDGSEATRVPHDGSTHEQAPRKIGARLGFFASFMQAVVAALRAPPSLPHTARWNRVAEPAPPRKVGGSACKGLPLSQVAQPPALNRHQQQQRCRSLLQQSMQILPNPRPPCREAPSVSSSRRPERKGKGLTPVACLADHESLDRPHLVSRLYERG